MDENIQTTSTGGKKKSPVALFAVIGVVIIATLVCVFVFVINGKAKTTKKAIDKVCKSLEKGKINKKLINKDLDELWDNEMSEFYEEILEELYTTAKSKVGKIKKVTFKIWEIENEMDETELDGFPIDGYMEYYGYLIFEGSKGTAMAEAEIEFCKVDKYWYLVELDADCDGMIWS